MTAAIGFHVRVVTKLEKGSYRGVGSKDDAAAVTAVTPDGAALRFVRFAMPGNDAVASGSCRDMDLDLIDESHLSEASPERARELVLVGYDTDDPAAAQVMERDGSRGLGEQGVVVALADIQPRVNLRSALTHDDHPGFHLLATELLDTEPLGLGIAAVA
jgi:hypothetical protein